MMTVSIAHIVFDLPLERHFDYAIPEHLRDRAALGMRVMVPFGRLQKCGFIVGLVGQSRVEHLKSIKSLCEARPVFDEAALGFAKDFSRAYGCSLGEALAAMLPSLLRQGRKIETPSHKGAASFVSLPRKDTPSPVLFFVRSGGYEDILRRQVTRALNAQSSVLVLVPDIFMLGLVRAVLKKHIKNAPIFVDEAKTLKGQADHWLQVRQARGAVVLGTRSSVFAPIVDLGLAVMIDEENDSYKQEQTPLYETRDALLMRARHQGFEVAFCSTAPSLELWHQVIQGNCRREDLLGPAMVEPQAVDMSNYKYVPGMLSPPVRSSLEAALKVKGKGILVLNRRGSYSMTRCVDCGEVLKCGHCDSPLMYSRKAKKFLCRYCAYSLPADGHGLPAGTQCPHCRRPSWKSFGVGVEQLQAELTQYFPQAVIASFEREGHVGLDNFDILITTRAVLRFKGILKAQVIAFVDFDAELNRMDMRSSFRAWALVRHLSSMACGRVFIQSRNSGHYVVKTLACDDVQRFYEEEMQLRKELGFSPFKHWVQAAFRAKNEKSAREMAQFVYNELCQARDQTHAVLSPVPDAVAKKRDQYRFNVMVQGDEAVGTMDFVKAALAKVKRNSRVIVTLNVDP